MDPWEHIFQSLKYDGSGELTLTATQIKECGKTWKGKASQFEPRLLAYQTSAASRPAIFLKHNLSMFPIKNGTYMLTKTPIYEPLDYTGTDTIRVVRDTSSLILSMGNSETSLIDNLRYSGVFERPELLGEPITHGPLLNGRHRCNLVMKLGDREFTVQGVQYETDSCYESAHKVITIEGKSSAKPIDSFNIRQLYFPYREICKVLQQKKEVLSLFIHEYKGVVHIWKYTFTDMNRMDSIQLLGHYMYSFSS